MIDPLIRKVANGVCGHAVWAKQKLAFLCRATLNPHPNALEIDPVAGALIVGSQHKHPHLSTRQSATDVLVAAAAVSLICLLLAPRDPSPCPFFFFPLRHFPVIRS